MTTAIAQHARDVQLSLVLENAGADWQRNALLRLAAFASATKEFTAEDFRLHCEVVRAMPHHHNAWGALFRLAKARKIVEPTGGMAPMSGPRSHARMTMLWRKVRP